VTPALMGTRRGGQGALVRAPMLLSCQRAKRFDTSGKYGDAGHEPRDPRRDRRRIALRIPAADRAAAVGGGGLDCSARPITETATTLPARAYNSDHRGPGQCLAPRLAATATQPFSRAPEISSDPPRKEEPMTLGKCESCGEPFAFRRGEPWLGHYRGRAPAKRFCSEPCRKREEARRYRLRKHRGGIRKSVLVK
jgi:hypothetical protein